MESDSVTDHPSGPERTEVSGVSSDVIDVTPAAKRKKQGKFMELLSDVMCSAAASSANQTVEDRAKIELQRYMEDSSYDGTVTPLKWWHHNKQRYPNLCKLALHYFTIPATSVPSERAFPLVATLSGQKEPVCYQRMCKCLFFLAENLP